MTVARNADVAHEPAEEDSGSEHGDHGDTGLVIRSRGSRKVTRPERFFGLTYPQQSAILTYRQSN